MDVNFEPNQNNRRFASELSPKLAIILRKMVCLGVVIFLYMPHLRAENNGLRIPNSFIASGDDYVVSLLELENRQVLSINGLVNDNGSNGSLRPYYEALSFIRKDKDIVVALDSGGGNAENFRLMMKWLRNRAPQAKIIAYVPRGGQCSSACINFFLLADIRLSAPNALFGFHSASHSDTGKLMPGLAEEYLRKSKIDENFLKFLISQKVFATINPTYFTGHELKDREVIDGLELTNEDKIDYSSYRPRQKGIVELANLICAKLLSPIKWSFYP